MEGWNSKAGDTSRCSLDQTNHGRMGVRQERPAIRNMENLLFGPIDDWIGGLLEKLADEDSKALAMLPNGMCLRGAKFLDHFELGIRICVVKRLVPWAITADVVRRDGVAHQVLQHWVDDCTVPTQAEARNNFWNEEDIELVYDAAFWDRFGKN